MKIPSSPRRTYEGMMHEISRQLGKSQFYIKLKGSELIDSERGHLGIGVVYKPSDEMRKKDYSSTQITKQYDHFIFIDETSALNSISEISSISKAEGFPSTWPAGT